MTTLRLRRIRAGARLRGYHRAAADMSVIECAARVERGDDPESLGYDAVIE